MTTTKFCSAFLAAVTALWLAGTFPSLGKDIRTVALVQDADYPPFMFAEEDGPAGIYADIIRAADERLTGYDIDLRAVPWTRAKYMVETGKAHGLVGTYYRPVERYWIRHFSTPMATETVYLFCREGIGHESWAYPKDYAGYLFTNNAGFSTPGAKFFEMVKSGDILLVEEQTTAENLRLVHLGRADCYVQQKAAAEIAIGFNNFNNIRPVREVLNEPAHIGYSEHWSTNEGDAFITAMDKVLQDMVDEGAIKKIILQWTDGTI